MRLNRNTIILVVISLVVIGVILVLNGNQVSAPDNASTVDTEEDAGGLLFPDASAESLVRFEVHDNTTEQLTVLTKNTEGTWTIAEASNSTSRETDQEKAAQVVDGAATLAYTEHFSAEDVQDNFDLANYGLAEPNYTISMADDSTTYTVYVGNENPGSSHYYVQFATGDSEPDDNVYLVAHSQVTKLSDLVESPPYVPLPTSTPTPYPTANPYSEVEQTATAAVEIEMTATAQAEMTAEVTPEVTSEMTVEVTPEVTPEVTAEVTPEVTPEAD